MKNKNQTIKEYLAELGRKGGKARAEKSTFAQRKKWGSKGGRPRKSETNLLDR